MLPASVETFVREVANSPLKVSILAYFWPRPGLMATTRTLAQMLVSEPQQAHQAVEELATAGVLTAISAPKGQVLCYLDPRRQTPTLTNALGRFAQTLESRPGELRSLVLDLQPGTEGATLLGMPTQLQLAERASVETVS